MERKYAVVTYQAAPLAVMDALRLVAECGGYSLDELAPSIALARLATNQLPRCAVTLPRLQEPDIQQRTRSFVRQSTRLPHPILFSICHLPRRLFDMHKFHGLLLSVPVSSDV